MHTAQTALHAFTTHLRHAVAVEGRAVDGTPLLKLFAPGADTKQTPFAVLLFQPFGVEVSIPHIKISLTPLCIPAADLPLDGAELVLFVMEVTTQYLAGVRDALAHWCENAKQVASA